MAIRTLLKFRNLDRTKDINDIFVKLIPAGIFDGGNIGTVTNQLKITVSPFKVYSRYGMVVEETSLTNVLSVSAGQTNVVALKAVYVENNDPIVELGVWEIGIFNGLPDIEDYVVFAHIVIPIGAIQVAPSNIDLVPRDDIDKLGRSPFRGVLSNSSILPLTQNRIGDFYMVTLGDGTDPTNLWGWDGASWVVMTDFVQLSSDLLQHRNNGFPNEKHLSDDEKLAVVGTSGTPVSITNKLIDDADTRIPTQDENDALVGSHGSPSGTNSYVTEALPFAMPNESSFVGPTDVLQISAGSGPFYVGSLGVGTVIPGHFRLYHITEAREYEDSDGTTVSITGVFKDAGLTMELTDPSSESPVVVDEEGFYIAGPIWVKLSSVPDSDIRVVYGKRLTLEDYPIDFFMKRHPVSAQTNIEVLQKFTETTGRVFDEVVPVDEQNINLRRDVVDTKEYIQSALDADFVVGDFQKAASVPIFKDDFPENVGIYNYRYLNSGLVGYNYNNTNGRVSFTGAVTLGSVQLEDVFRDGSGREFKIVSVSASTVDIVDRKGNIPFEIDNSVTHELSGSIKADNNPRQLNMATLQMINHRERISVIEIRDVANEFHPITGDIAFSINDPLKQIDYKEPRVRLYGNWKNKNLFNPLLGPTGQQTNQVVSVNEARIRATGFFNDLEMVMDVTPNSPIIEVIVDGKASASTFIDLSESGNAVSFGSSEEVKQKHIRIASDLTDALHDVEIIIPNASVDFIFYGFHFIRTTITNSRVTPGRAFVQADLFKNDTDVSLAIDSIDSLERGAVIRTVVDRDLNLSETRYDLKSFDGNTPPSGTAIAATPNFTVSSNLTKFRNYFREGDVVKLATALVEEVKQIDTITDNGIDIDIVFTNNVGLAGAAQLVHVCATDENAPADPTEEVRRMGAIRFGLANLSEYQIDIPLVVDRINILEDSTTKFHGQQISFVETPLEGAEYAVQLNAPSILRISAVCSKLDLIVANDSPISGDVSIDGSPFNNVMWGGYGLKRITVLSNARFQQHEVRLENFSGLQIAGLILYEPALSTKPSGTNIAELKLMSRYNKTNPNGSGVVEGINMPLGSYGIDAYAGMVKFVNGAGFGVPWNSTIDFVESASYGRFNVVDQELAYAEWNVYGTAFEVEYCSGPDRGFAFIELNGIVANSSNYLATYRGMDSVTGVIDMYSPIPERKRFSISGLTAPVNNRFNVRLRIANPLDKNPLSTGFKITINQVFLPNSNGLFGFANQRSQISDKYFGFTSAYDLRNVGGNGVTQDAVDAIVLSKNDVTSVQPDLIDGGTF